MSTAPTGYQTPKTNWQSGSIPLPADFNRAEGNSAAIETGNRTIDQTQAPSSNAGNLRQFLDWLTNRIKAITGKTNWYDAPDTTLAAAKSHIDASSAHNATSAATASRLMIRDANGRAKVAAPSASDDIARKDTVDTHAAGYITHVPYGVASGSVNAYTVTLSPALAAYAEGVALAVKINIENTGPATINVNSLGAKSIKKSSGEDVGAGDLKASSIYTLRYNGANFILQGEGGGPGPTANDVYWYGQEPVPWVDGYSSGIRGKTANAMYLIIRGNSGRFAYVTDVPVDLTGKTTLHINCIIGGYGASYHRAYGGVSTSKTDTDYTAGLYLDVTNLGEQTMDIDVSSLSGEHYVKVHVQAAGTDSHTAIAYIVNRIWFD